MKKKKRKCYLSCKELKKIDYQRALSTRYILMFTDDIEDADMFVAPMEKDGLSDKQKRELDKAAVLGIRQRIVLNEDKILNETNKDPLELKTSEIIVEDKGFSMELD